MQILLKRATQLYGKKLFLNKGFCYGIVFAAIDKYLHGNFAFWHSVHSFILSYNSENILHEISLARNNALTKNSLSDAEVFLLRVNAFFEEIILLQGGPRFVPDLYLNSIPNSQDYKPTNELLYLDKIDQLQLCNQQIRIDDFSSFRRLLREINNTKQDYSIAYSLSFCGHRVAMLPQYDKEGWIIVNHDIVHFESSYDVIWSSIAAKYSFIPDEQKNFENAVVVFKLESFSLGEKHNIDFLIDKVFVSDGVMASLNKSNYSGAYLVNIAVKFNNKDLLEELVRRGFDLVKKNKGGLTVLHQAVIYNHITLANWLISKIDINTIDADGCSPLQMASIYNRPLYSNFLVKSGADIDLKNFFGDTALHYAAFIGSVDLIESLISAGANPHITNKFGKTLLHFAAESNNFISYKHVESYFSSQITSDILDLHGNTVLHSVAASSIKRLDNFKLVNYLIRDKRIDVNLTNNMQESILYKAAQGGHHILVSHLLRLGANINNPTKKGLLAIHVAAAAGRLSVVELLISYDSSLVNIRDKNNSTPLHHAIKNRNYNVIRFLLSHGARTDLVDRKGQTALFLAQDYDLDKDVITLLEKQINTYHYEKDMNARFSPTTVAATIFSTPRKYSDEKQEEAIITLGKVF